MKNLFYPKEVLDLVCKMAIDAIGQVVCDPEKFRVNEQAIMIRGIMFLVSEIEEKLTEGNKDESAED